MRTAWVIGFATLACLVGCSSGTNATDAKTDDFSLNPTSESMLLDIERNGGALSVCIALVDSPADAQSWRDRAVANINDTTRAWNDLIKDHPLWSVREIVPRYTFVNGRQCSPSSAMVKVNIWTSVARFKSSWCAGQPECASSASPKTRTFGLGPWNRTAPADPLEPFATLHEYGHLLGLGDTYKIPGYNSWIGEQPPAVMNGMSETLTDDDKLGLWAMLNALKTGRRSCDGFGHPVKMTANTWGSVMCDTRSVVIDTHGDVIVQTGPIPEDVLNSAKLVTVSTDQLNCRSAPGTENAVVQKIIRGDTLDTGEVSPGVRFVMAADGTPWLHITYANDVTDCYVSARYEYIDPKSE